MIHRAERFTDVMEQGNHDQLFVGAVTHRAGGGLQAVTAAVEIIGLIAREVVNHRDQAVRQIGEGLLVDPLEDLEILVVALVHPGEMHLVHEAVPSLHAAIDSISKKAVLRHPSTRATLALDDKRRELRKRWRPIRHPDRAAAPEQQ